MEAGAEKLGPLGAMRAVKTLETSGATGGVGTVFCTSVGLGVCSDDWGMAAQIRPSTPLSFPPADDGIEMQPKAAARFARQFRSSRMFMSPIFGASLTSDF